MAATMIIDSEADPRRRDRGYHTTEAHTLYQMSQLLLFTLHDVILSFDHLVTLSELALKTRLPP